jgi:hypothetical protein
MNRLLTAIPFALASCTPDTTEFRTTDESDPSDPERGASYRLRVGQHGSARVQVWSYGGYVGTSDEPMTHVGFDIHNTGTQPLVFDVSDLRLAVEDAQARKLPPPKLTSVTPLGPEKIRIPPGSSAMFDSYFQLKTQPADVEKMQVRWTLSADSSEIEQHTTFVRTADDDGMPVLE